MSLYGAFDQTKHLEELGDPLDTQEGVLTAATRRVTALQNLLGDTDIVIADLLAADVTAGDAENDKLLRVGTATEDTALLDFSSVTLADGANVIRGASLDFEDVTGWLVFSGNTEDDAFRYSAYFQPQTSSSGKLLGLGNTGILQSGTSVNVAEAAQLHLIVQSGATITTRGGDPTAGVHPVWAKVQGDVGSTWNSGCRVAPIWADYQINGSDLSGEESYMALLSAGSNIHAIFRFEGGGNATYLLETSEGLGNGFMASSGYDDTMSNTPAGFMVVNLNGTSYGVPLMSAT